MYQITIVASTGEKRAVLSIKNRLIGMGDMESFIARAIEKLGCGGFIAIRSKLKKDDKVIYEYNDVVGFNIFHDSVTKVGVC